MQPTFRPRRDEEDGGELHIRSRRKPDFSPSLAPGFLEHGEARSLRGFAACLLVGLALGLGLAVGFFERGQARLFLGFGLGLLVGLALGLGLAVGFFERGQKTYGRRQVFLSELAELDRRIEDELELSTKALGRLLNNSEKASREYIRVIGLAHLAV